MKSFIQSENMSIDHLQMIAHCNKLCGYMKLLIARSEFIFTITDFEINLVTTICDLLLNTSEHKKTTHTFRNKKHKLTFRNMLRL